MENTNNWDQHWQLQEPKFAKATYHFMIKGKGKEDNGSLE